MTMTNYELLEVKLDELKELIRWSNNTPKCSVESIILKIDIEEKFEEIKNLAEHAAGNIHYFLNDEVINREYETEGNLQIEDYKVENWYDNKDPFYPFSIFIKDK